MFEWARFGELFIIVMAALFLIGPKELPVVLRNLGRWMRRIQEMTRDVRSILNYALQEKDVEIYQQTLNEQILKAEEEKREHSTEACVSSKSPSEESPPQSGGSPYGHT